MKKYFIPLYILSIPKISCTPVAFKNRIYDPEFSGFDFSKQIANFKRILIKNYTRKSKNMEIGYRRPKQDCNLTFTYFRVSNEPSSGFTGMLMEKISHFSVRQICLNKNKTL